MAEDITIVIGVIALPRDRLPLRLKTYRHVLSE
jgi:hypothetical protein